MLCGNSITAIFGVADAEMQTALKTEESLKAKKFRSEKSYFCRLFSKNPPSVNKKRRLDFTPNMNSNVNIIPD